MTDDPYAEIEGLDTRHPIWERVFTVAPLVLIGTREESGEWDLAPKHMAYPLGWENHFGFVCTPVHSTYANVQREGIFTVSYPRPDQVVLASLAASPRCDDGSKLAVDALPTLPARVVDGIFLRDSYLFLECELERIVDGFGANSLIAGRVAAAWAYRPAIRRTDKDDQEVIAQVPLLTYLHPGRVAEIRETNSFPFPAGFSR